MTAGKQGCPGEVTLVRGVTNVQWLLADLCCPEVEGGRMLLLQPHDMFLTNNSANLASVGCYLPTQTWESWCLSKSHSSLFFSVE